MRGLLSLLGSGSCQSSPCTGSLRALLRQSKPFSLMGPDKLAALLGMNQAIQSKPLYTEGLRHLDPRVES